MAAVTTTLTALADRLADYTRIRDCVSGQRAIKLKRTTYLPDPDESEPNETARTARYNNYLARAVFYGVTGRTLRGLVGLVFDKDPAIEAPPLLAPVLADASGSGVKITQQAQAVLADVVAIARAGLLTDYPRTEGPATRQDQLSGNIRPTITFYRAEDVINWRTRTVGSKVLLSLVVLRESYVVEDDGFSEKIGTRYRVLRLDDNGVYQVEVHTMQDDGQAPAVDTFTPTDGAGKPLREIPFTFVGALDNEPTIDEPPLLDIAEINVAHFRNSADYEESCFMLGQPTPVLSGLTKQWVDEVLGGKVRLGSRGAISLPVGGSAELLQVQPNTMAFEAMEHKEKQMLALGAKLLENTGTEQTATEATQDFVLDNSVLATCSRNVSAAYRMALGWAHLYMTGDFIDDQSVLDFELNTDFASRMLTSADRSEIVGEWQKGAITWDEMRWNLKRAGVAYEDDEQAKEIIAEAKQETIDMEAAAAAALADATGVRQPPNAAGA